MYTELKSYQIIIALLKEYGIRHLVLSAGSRNVPFVHSVEEDPYFTCYSVVDELQRRLLRAWACSGARRARRDLLHLLHGDLQLLGRPSRRPSTRTCPSSYSRPTATPPCSGSGRTR